MNPFIKGLGFGAIYGIFAGIFGALLGKIEKFIGILIDFCQSWV